MTAIVGALGPHSELTSLPVQGSVQGSSWGGAAAPGVLSGLAYFFSAMSSRNGLNNTNEGSSMEGFRNGGPNVT
jgi:hypothetical protein